eukprot:3948780-Ditylum_brightwellii.AAC.1
MRKANGSFFEPVEEFEDYHIVCLVIVVVIKIHKFFGKEGWIDCTIGANGYIADGYSMQDVGIHSAQLLFIAVKTRAPCHGGARGGVSCLT